MRTGRDLESHYHDGLPGGYDLVVMPTREFRSPNDSRPVRTVPLAAIVVGAFVVQVVIVGIFVVLTA